MRNQLEWNEMNWNGMERNGMQCKEMKCNAIEWVNGVTTAAHWASQPSQPGKMADNLEERLEVELEGDVAAELSQVAKGHWGPLGERVWACSLFRVCLMYLLSCLMYLVVLCVCLYESKYI